MGESASSWNPVVVGIGEILWDVFPSGKHLGGAPANVAVQARSLGAEGIVVSAVGDDEDGREILETLFARGLNREFVATVPGARTGRVTVALDAEGVPEFTIHERVAWDVLPSTPALSSLAARAEAVCFGTLAQRSPVSRASIRAFLEATKPDCLRVFDVNIRQRFYSLEIVRDLLARSQVVKLNEDELRTLAEMFSLRGTERDLLSWMLDLFPGEVIALTRGRRGSWIFGRKAESHHPGFDVEVVDTVGAGDAFTAALVMGLLEKWNLDEINERANRVAAFVCSREGAWPEIPADLACRPGKSPAEWRGR
jgi:fructokinase